MQQRSLNFEPPSETIVWQIRLFIPHQAATDVVKGIYNIFAVHSQNQRAAIWRCFFTCKDSTFQSIELASPTCLVCTDDDPLHCLHGMQSRLFIRHTAEHHSAASSVVLDATSIGGCKYRPATFRHFSCQQINVGKVLAIVSRVSLSSLHLWHLQPSF